jgi:hypothetical protein
VEAPALHLLQRPRTRTASRSAVDRLAILLGIAVGLVPTVPVLVLYAVLSRAVVDRENPA